MHRCAVEMVMRLDPSIVSRVEVASFSLVAAAAAALER